MNPIRFEQCNCIMGENQPQYLPLHACRHKDDNGTVTTCWELSFRERLRILFTGKIFLSLLTFDKPIQPQKISLVNPLEV